MAFPKKNGCSKSKDFPNLVEKSPGYVWNLCTKGCAKASITATVEQKFATVFSIANWITPSFAGAGDFRVSFVGGGIILAAIRYLPPS